MTDKYQVRTLKNGDLSQMYHSFIEAFSKYSVNMNMSRSAFQDRMIQKLRLAYEYSPGVFVGDKLVAFLFHSIQEYEGVKSAYNGGTGVIPGYWGRGLTKMMYEAIVHDLRKQNVQRSVLEVITTNEKALKAYHKVGFQISKYYKCFKTRAVMGMQMDSKHFKTKVAYPQTLHGYIGFQTTIPSMLDCNALLTQNLQNESVLESYRGDELVGYIVFQSKVGRISQVAVSEEYRCQGVGRELVRAALSMSETESLTVINVEENQVDVISFLLKIGFQNQLDQYEMELTIQS